MEKTKSRSKSKMTSIARKINFSYWRRQLFSFLLLDALLAAMAAAAYVIWRKGLLPEVTKNGAIPLLKTALIVLLSAEALNLLIGLFNEGRARRHMKPLYEMAIRMEELSREPFDPKKMEDIEQAISHLNTDNPVAKITTDDAELKGLEIAINDMLERMRESHRQQDRFVSDASHELRTPIAVIQGYVNMLDRWGKEDPQVLDESIEALKNESEHMKTLVEQLLFLARGDSGKNHLELKEFDLAAMVCDVYEESLMIDPLHRYEFRPADESVTVRGDPAMLKQSLRIITQNAAKYSAENSTITLSACLVEGRPAYVVQDEGMGMSEADVKHVFERFYRSDEARNSEKSGTGLGLSIAKWIIDEHHGQIKILSRPEFGSRFTVIL